MMSMVPDDAKCPPVGVARARTGRGTLFLPSRRAARVSRLPLRLRGATDGPQAA